MQDRQIEEIKGIDSKIKTILWDHVGTIKNINIDMEAKLKGKWVLIVSDYNGQPFGVSRPSMTGQEGIIIEVDISKWGVNLILDITKYKEFLTLDDIVFLEDI